MPSKRYWLLSLGIFLTLFLHIPHIFSQDRTKFIQVSRIETPPRIDGLIQDSCWKTIQPVSGFFQYDPVNGAKASEETLVWAAYDQKNIYFAFLMKDSRPEQIWAELTPRNDYENNDSITLILDTYNDKRTSITFTVNPKGVQKNSVETIWKSSAVVRSDGWSAEMTIPFKSLRFSPEENQIWGINFERYIHRLNEMDYWTDVDRDKPLLHQMGELSGLSGIRPGYNLEFFPYAGVRSTRWDGEDDDKVAGGLDVKYGILPNLYLDVTASPDFSEVESDPFIFQLSPYENYLQENRPFFTEGSQYFRLSTEDEDYWEPSISLFYSRRVSDPRRAAKISGKAGGFSFGILGALNKKEEGKDPFFGVVRIQKDIFKNSQIGIYYASMQASEEYSRNFAVDYNFNFKDIYYLRGMSAFSFNNDTEKANNGIHIIQFERDADAGLQLMFDFQRIEENVNIWTGFINKIDAQSTELMTGYAWRFNRGQLKRFSLDFGGNLDQDTHGNTTGYSVDVTYWTEFLAQFFIHGGFSAGKSKYQIKDAADNLVWTEDFIQTYGGDFLDFHWERGGFLKEASVEVGWEKRGIYNEDFTLVEPGAETRIEAQVTLRPLSYFEWSVSSNWIKQTIDQTGETVFDGMTYATALHFQVTRSLFLSARLFGETRDDQYNFDFLVGYYFGAGNIIQLSYKKGARTEVLMREGGHSITLKVSYLLRI
ncbi:MAG: carbohydrate binding family 9 domain-containing protein [Candidatus Aminicenantes bacterium]|nr:carbohydrate binding family 9 domain-containing protein [Candidatus Aminicenantes bacterium]